MLTLVCAYCHNPAAHALRAAITKFTVFFIPLFTTSTKHHLQCTFCGGAAEVRSEHVNQLLGRAHHESVRGRGYGPGQQPGAHRGRRSGSGPAGSPCSAIPRPVGDRRR